MILRSSVSAPTVSRDRVAQGVAAIFSCDLRAVLGADSGLVQENVHLESSDRVRVETEWPVVNRVERIVEEPLWGFNVRSFTVGFDNDKLRDPGADLHERVRDSMQAVLREGVHRLLHRPKLIGCVLIEDG